MSGNEAIIELRGATILASEGGRVVLKNLNMAVRPGEFVMMHAGVDEETELFFDVCQGLVPVDTGDVLFCGTSWASMRTGRACSARSRTGRVFQRGGWLHDMDITENIMLREQHHHSLRSPRKLYVEALSYARAVGVKDLSDSSPEDLGKAELRKFQWVRACMGEPDLFLLERPELDVPIDVVARLMDLMQACCERGAAVIWVTSSPAVADHEKMLSVKKAVMKDGRVEYRDHVSGAQRVELNSEES